MAIQVLAELYMLTDKSQGYLPTHEFVERRVEDFREFEKFSKYVSTQLRGLIHRWSAFWVVD
jgi:hypothetical protein